MTIDDHPLRDSYADVIDGVSAADRLIEDLASLSIDVLAQVRQAICITDADLDEPGPRLRFVNSAYLDIFACEEADVLGESPRFAQGPLTSRPVLDRIRTHLAAGESIRAQTINYRVDGTPFRLRWSIDPVRLDGEIVHFVAIMNDVTTEERMRRRLAALDTLLTSARQSLPAAEALASALVPVLAEIGRATVTIDDQTVEVPGFVGGDTTTSTVRVGDIGSVQLDVHAEAGRLFDDLGVEELARHAAWLFEAPRRSD